MVCRQYSNRYLWVPQPSKQRCCGCYHLLGAQAVSELSIWFGHQQMWPCCSRWSENKLFSHGSRVPVLLPVPPRQWGCVFMIHDISLSNPEELVPALHRYIPT